MSSAPDVEPFKGTGWEECYDFIVAIRARALWEGKQRDSAWIADFAAPLFRRKALSWHGRLPQDVRQDWFKLEAALFDRWPEPEDDDEPDIQPTPAAAPSLNSTDKANFALQGVLKVVIDGLNTNRYVKEESGVCSLTNDAKEAVRTRCNTLSGATLLERIDHACHSWLGVQWRQPTPVIGDGSTNYASITYLDTDTLKSSWAYNSPFQLITCTVLANGEVIPVWKKSDTSKITLSFFVATDSLFLVTDPVAYGRHYSAEKRAKLFIEPTD
ncbi:hypothetical protein M407DRAFT_146705 [Tulasnella calospora MUT 4182]|uniref:Uncharacterized protein n=1 Tax=Tulasnella calospora MUT 4182 TaxID=1051891 RepID=A0A0C3PWZ0_9AGAM|nr:hypothetical protein M407DRAFT_146705 [Tulasnella calospora MUT 4182]